MKIPVRPWAFVFIGASVALLMLTFVIRQSRVTAAPAGSEISELTREDGEAGAFSERPVVNGIEAAECVAKNHLKPGEFIFGKQGAFIKVGVDGTFTQTSGEELSEIKIAYDPAQADAEIPIHLECAIDTEPAEGAGAPLATDQLSWYVASLRAGQFLSTKKGTAINLSIAPMDQNFFQTQINTTCVDQGEPNEANKPPCTRPKLTAITDLNHNGKREFWFLEPLKWDNGIGVVEEPDLRILSACPGCD